jgi:hypothetical protein
MQVFFRYCTPRTAVPLALVLLISANSSNARGDMLVRIGDADGFGYGAAPVFKAANGGPANAHGDPFLSNKDFLPDINRDGAVATGRHDDFDFRSSAEINNKGNLLGAGVSNAGGTLGSKYTDVSLSTSYDQSSAAHRVLVGGNPNTGLIFGAGGAFPTGRPSTQLPNQPGFVFSFDVNKANLASQTPIFFNLVFGDYDVTPAKIVITRADGSKKTITVNTQPKAEDGLIQAASATLTFGDVFGDGGSFWSGFLKVDFIAPNEPYTAFDYVELSTIQLVAPEPGSLALAVIGLVGVGIVRVRHRRGLVRSADRLAGTPQA